MTTAAARRITGAARWSTSPPAPPPPPKPPIGDAMVLPFPFIKRRAYLDERQIQNVANYGPAAAKRYLDERIADRVRLLRRTGVAEHLIAADIAPVAQIFRDRLRLMFGAGMVS
jgi:hypothetical protein